MPAGILTSTSLPVGSRSRSVTPCAASGSVTVSAAWTSAPMPKSSGSKAAPAPPRPAAAEGLLEDVLETAQTAAAAPARPRRVRAGEALGTEIEILEIRVGPEACARPTSRPRTAAAKALKPRLALGVDLAAIERFALVLVAEHFMRGVQLGKARRCLWIVLVGVGMQFLGKLAGRRS